MFDAKSLIEMMMKGAGGQPAPQAGGGLGGLADILGKLGGGGQAQAPAAQSSGSGMGGLGDLLGKLGVGGHGSQQPPAQAAGGGLTVSVGLETPVRPIESVRPEPGISGTPGTGRFERVRLVAFATGLGVVPIAAFHGGSLPTAWGWTALRWSR